MKKFSHQLCFTKIFFSFLLMIFSGSTYAQGTPQKQFLNLNDPHPKPRFKVTPPVWPDKVGEMDVCLWANDKMAAVTFGVDDNICPEHDWWLEMGKKYNIRNTWFVIVYPLMYKYDGSKGTGQGFFGTIEKFQRVYDAGHDVQAHGTTAINKLPPEDYEKDVLFTIETLKKIKGNPVNTYAYPGGDAKGHKREIIAKHCIGSRGTIGGVNYVNQVDYLNIRTGRVTPETLASMLDDPKSRYYRGWLSQFVHAIATAKDPETRKSMYAGYENRLKLVAARRNELWVPTYREAFLYAQSRDTAKLTPGTVSPEKITFSLTDDMKDDVYTYPLTVKVRIADNWDAVNATQAGKPIDTQFVMHDSKKYLLVQAVPDGGEVTLAKAPPTVCLPPTILTPAGKYRDKVDISAIAPTSGAEIRYTLDGSEPTANSTQYDKPIQITKDSTLTFKAAAFKEDLKPSPVVSHNYEVFVDKTPPKLLTGDAAADTPYLILTFSEKLDKTSSETPANYAAGGLTINKAQLLNDGQTVVLTAGKIPGGKEMNLTIKNIKDLSGNTIEPITTKMTPAQVAKDKGLVGWYRFAESPTAGGVLDSAGTVGPALVEGTPKREKTEKGPAFVFDEKTRITTPNTTFGLNKSNTFTVSFWVQFDGPLKGNLVAKGRYAMPFSFSGYAGRQSIQAYARIGKSIKQNLPEKIQRDQWVHVAMTAGDGKLVLYQNGKPVSTQELDIKVQCPNELMRIGGGFVGKIADLRIYNRALPADQIAKLAK